MKELSVEEKAKRYESSLERCRKLYNEAKANEYNSDIEDYEAIFPELKESEDEKIVDAIRKALESKIEDLGNGVTRTACLAWLEKQGTPNQTSIWKHWKDGIAGNGEGKPIYLIKYARTYSLSSCLCFECDYIELSELDKLLSEKQGEQKPQRMVSAEAKEALYDKPDWGKEDESYLNTTIAYLKDAKEFKKTAENCIDWLNSLKQRIGG